MASPPEKSRPENRGRRSCDPVLFIYAGFIFDFRLDSDLINSDNDSRLISNQCAYIYIYVKQCRYYWIGGKAFVLLNDERFDRFGNSLKIHLNFFGRISV